MEIMHVAIFLLVGASGTALVLTRDPSSQTVGLSFYGLVLAVMFFIFQAPDVAYSQIVVGEVALPLMFMLALTKVRREEDRRAAARHGETVAEHSRRHSSPDENGKNEEAA